MLRHATLQSTRRLSWVSSRLTSKRTCKVDVGCKPAVSGAWQQQYQQRHQQQYAHFGSRTSTGDDGEDEDMESFDPMTFHIDDEEIETEEQKEDRKGEERRQKIRDELDTRTGRLWTDEWEITDEEWSTKRTSADLPDWTPDMCSRISLERIKVHPDGILSISDLSKLALPPPPPPHPGHGNVKAYARERRSDQFRYVEKEVGKLVAPKIDGILKLSSWQDKQDAVDELYESIEFELKEKEPILGNHPRFALWVERALEDYLRNVTSKDSAESSSSKAVATSVEEIDTVENSDAFPTEQEDASALPIFCDLYQSEEGPEVIVPNILYPLKTHAKDGPGRMAEEWELIAHKKTRRILLRQCTRSVARSLSDGSKPARVYMHGKRGVGKTAVLSTIVASARHSGHIVLYLPDGDRLRKLFYYIEPSHREGMFDCPMLSMEICSEFLESHEDDLKGMVVSADSLSKFMKEDQIRKLPIETESGEKSNIPLVDLLKLGGENETYAPLCYSVAIHSLMNQTDRSFVIAADDFNCYYDHGFFFHMDYDADVKRSIPCNRINLFEPFMNAMGISANIIEDEVADSESIMASVSPPIMMKRGGIIVSTTESHAVAPRFTNALMASANLAAASDEETHAPLHVVEVPRFSNLEVEHIISNMEATGLGRLRFDRGDTVMNENEVAYIRMVSGAVGQNILDECIV